VVPGCILRVDDDAATIGALRRSDEDGLAWCRKGPINVAIESLTSQVGKHLGRPEEIVLLIELDADHVAERRRWHSAKRDAGEVAYGRG
jgi:hypothetical protein